MFKFITGFFKSFFSKMYCRNCGTSEKAFKINVRKNSQLFTANFLITTTASIPYGLHIRPLVCFKCDHVTEWAADQSNLSGNAIEGFEYFNSYKISQNLKDKTKQYAKNNNFHIALEKIEKLQIN
jgi:hypothetical protein